MLKSLNVILAAIVTAGAVHLITPTASVAQPAPPASTSQPTPARHSERGTATVKAALQPPRNADGASELASLTPPQKSSAATRSASAQASAADLSCTPADFGSRTGAALVSFVKASQVEECLYTLYDYTGTNAYGAFKESQMVTIANAMRDTSYPGDNSTSMLQLVVFLRAGYYVHFYHPAAVGTYGPALQTGIRAGLDRFFAAPATGNITDNNGRILGESVTLIDSSDENARYLYIVRRLLNGFNSQINANWYMRNATNNTFAVLFRGHQKDDFKAAVVADPSIIDVVYNFGSRNLNLLGTDSAFLTANAGGETARFLRHTALQSKTRPLTKWFLDNSSITGTRAKLWIQTAVVADAYDKVNCSYYGICNLKSRLEAASLPITHVCSATITIRAQNISTTNLNTACSSMAGQVSYFHNIARAPGPVANDYNTKLEVVAFHSSDDYQTYAGPIFGIDTNNGGMYLEGDPSVVGNMPRFIAYEAEWLRPAFEIWNLNHEFTHYLDGRFNMYGDFQAGLVRPNIWWVEGFAEYISYHYRNIPNTAAINEARNHTYPLSTLWNTTYENSNTSRIYQWGYLATRYMLERHRSDLDTVLARFRTGDYAGAYNYYTVTIGTRYNTDFNSWLDSLSSTPGKPTANFSFTVNGLTASFTDTSTGSITSRSWNFGDGTTSTATNPTKTYTSAGTYTVSLTVTGPGGNHTKSTPVTVNSGPSGCPPENYIMGNNCTRTGLSGSQGNLAYYTIYVPAGATLRINTSGGTGDVDIYYHPSTWATNTNYTARSIAGGNTDQITLSNTTAGWRYITLYGYTAYNGVTFTTRY